MVVIEAEHFQNNTPGSGHAWVPTTNLAGFVGVSAMQCLPDSGTTLSSVAGSPLLAYSIQITNSGVFNLWIRGWAPNASADSVYLGLDGALPRALSYSSVGAWMWKAVPVTITNAGTHEIDLWMREDGAYVDRLLLAQDPTYLPTGTGPAEAEVTLNITSPVEGANFNEFATIPVSVQASPSSSPFARVDFYVNGVLAGLDTNAPYSFTWIPAAGHYRLSAIAVDNFGGFTTSAPVSVTITSLPPATVSYDSSSESIFVTGGGRATLTQIKTALPQAPLSLVDPSRMVWFLGAKIIVQDGSTLQLHGSALGGGDVNELRLKSDPASATNSYVWLDADWGTLDLQNVKVTSWDEAVDAPAIQNAIYAKAPRAFIRARSRLVGTDVQQSTLNVANSEIGWLGFDDGQSYGLTWDVVGAPPGVVVFGAVSGSSIHDCQLGANIWAGGGVIWTSNEVATNTVYGFNPNDPAQQTLLARNNVHDNTYGATFRWSSTEQRIYISGQGQATLSDIKAALPTAPLCLLNAGNHVWFLGASLEIVGGATLAVHGTRAGGDANKLLLRSDNSHADGSCVAVDADWGTLDFRSVQVISWDQLAAAPDTEFATFGRACIRARSRRLGATIQQSTLNVVDSEIGWLGVNSSDSCALTWQVVGSAPGVTVFGVVSNCFIHDCRLGVASWFARSIYGNTVQWSGNTLAANMLFGFDPTDTAQAAVLARNRLFGNDFAPIFRWARTTGRIYVTGQGTATLSDITRALPAAPLTLLDATNQIWFLGANLYVVNGTHLKLYGPAAGGDVSELRLKSEHPAGSNDIVQLRVDWGWLDLQHTKITSWDRAVNGPDIITNIYTQPRSYIHARSTLDTDGRTAHESRMDANDCDIGFLGYHAKEAYGLVWKVVDTTAAYIPPGSTNTLYDLVKVYGNIVNCRLHHNCFGMYSYGHAGGAWTSNEVDHNLAYGFDPHNYSNYLDIENNNVHDNGWHGIIASIGCRYGVLRNNLSSHNGADLSQGRGNGIMLHRSSSEWLVENNQSFNNRDSGIALFSSDGNLVRNNLCSSNGNAGMRLSVGCRNNLVDGNQFFASGGNGVFLYPGTNSPGLDEATGRCQANTFTNNLFSGAGLSGADPEAIRVVNCDSNLFTANVIIESGIGAKPQLHFDGGTNNLVAGNTLPADTLVTLAGATNIDGFPDFAYTTFTGQPRLALRLGTNSTATFTDPNGAIFAFDQTNSPLLILTNVVAFTGSVATLTAAMAGSQTNSVVTRKLFALPGSGTAQIVVTTWNLAGTRNKAWSVGGSSASMSIAYRVGDLAPGTSYVVRRGASQVNTTTSDSIGYISFTSNPGTASLVSYTVDTF